MLLCHLFAVWNLDLADVIFWRVVNMLSPRCTAGRPEIYGLGM